MNKKFSQFGSGTPVGTDIVLYADPVTGALHKVTIDDILALAPLDGVETVSGGLVDNTDPANPVVGLPYKVYTALLTQSGTDAPVATVLENTLGGTVVWTRTNAGNYVGTIAGVFVDGSTFILPNIYGYQDTNGAGFYLNVGDVNTILVHSFDGGTGSDGVLVNASIEVRVYN